jgi:hypothetical protein
MSALQSMMGGAGAGGMPGAQYNIRTLETPSANTYPDMSQMMNMMKGMGMGGGAQGGRGRR